VGVVIMADKITEDDVLAAVEAAQTADYNRLCNARQVAKWTADHHPDLGIVDHWLRSEQDYRVRQREVIRLHRLLLERYRAEALTAEVEQWMQREAGPAAGEGAV
jgi:primosomal protein N''